MKAKVYVTLKRSVLDPQGKAVRHAIAVSGIFELKDARVGKFIELDLGEIDRDKAKQKIEEMCQKLLANTVIEEYSYEMV